MERYVKIEKLDFGYTVEFVDGYTGRRTRAYENLGKAMKKAERFIEYGSLALSDNN